MVLRKKTDITKSELFYFFIIAPFLQPANYVFPSIINKLLDVWKLAAIVLSLGVYVSRRKLSRFMIAAALFQLMTPLSTLLNPLSYSSQLKGALINACTNIAILMAAETGLKAQPLKFIKAVAYYGGMMCLTASATMFIFYSKGGMDQKEYMDALGDVNFYFLGHDNRSYFIFITVQLAVIILSLTKHGRLSAPAAAFNIIVTAAFFYVRSASAMVCTTLIWIYLLFFMNKNKGSVMNFKNFFIIFLTFEILIVFLNFQNAFSFFFTGVLNKSTTLSGRTIIWEKAIAYIKNSFLTGYGSEPLGVLLIKLGINHAHNIVLDIMYSQGAIGLALYAVILAMCGKKLMKHKTDPIGATVSFVFFVFLICSVFDYYNTIPYIMLLYSFGVNIEHIINIPRKNTGYEKKIIGESYVTNQKLT